MFRRAGASARTVLRAIVAASGTPVPCVRCRPRTELVLTRSARPSRSILPSRAPGAARLRRDASPLLVALGDLMLDVVVAPTRAIERGTDVPGSVTFRRGGSAANVCAAFVRAGGRARLVTCVGTDPWV